MCGIVGYIGKQDAAPLILESLKKLEYRGYDSAGIAVVTNGRAEVRRCEGKLKNLESLLEREPIRGTIGIGHTRWATHGRPSETNAHPHRAGDVVVVHNGIIENYLDLKAELIARDTKFSSETDTEIVAHLVGEKVAKGIDFFEAVRKSLKEIHGSYALLFLNQKDPTRLVVAKNSTPIVIGWGDGETFIASDIPALLDHTRKVTFLEDGEVAEVAIGSFRLFDGKGKAVQRPVKEITWDAVAARKDGYDHFMLKEIHDQPRAIADTFRGRISLKEGDVALEDLRITDSQAKKVQRLHLVACGTAWHACLVGKFMLEEIAGPSGGSRLRLRVSLSLADDGFAFDALDGEPVRRNRGYARGGGNCPAEKSQGSLHLQRRRFLHPEKVGRRFVYPRRAGDQRREHQGLYDAAYRALSLGGRVGAAPRNRQSRASEKLPGGSLASAALDRGSAED